MGVEGGAVKQIRWQEAVGKTVTGFAEEDDRAIFTFTDGTFIHLEACPDWGSCASLGDLELNFGEFSHEKLLQLGIMTQEEAKKLREERYASDTEAREKNERQEYERLRKKYGE